jgi:DNA-binding NarL/FixJ family response regulator
MQTAFDDSDKIFTSIVNGASGYILKKDKPQRILQAIEELNEGGGRKELFKIYKHYQVIRFFVHFQKVYLYFLQKKIAWKK